MKIKIGEKTIKINPKKKKNLIVLSFIFYHSSSLLLSASTSKYINALAYTMLVSNDTPTHAITPFFDKR
jgi:hypothetical protein